MVRPLPHSSQQATAAALELMLPVGGAAADGDDQLQESLLGDEDQPSSAPMQPSSTQHHQQQIIHYQPFHLESFIHWVLRSWAAFLSEWRAVQLGRVLHRTEAWWLTSPGTLLLPQAPLAAACKAYCEGAGAQPCLWHR